MSFFQVYNPKIDYNLNSVTEFAAIPSDLQPMYTVHEVAKCQATQMGVSHELLVKYVVTQPSDQPLVVCTKPEFLRLSVANRLRQAAEHLKQASDQAYVLLLKDAYRSLDQQRQQFKAIRQHLQTSGLDDELLYRKTVEIISDPDLQPPHATGGTVDITLCDAHTGQELWLGTNVDAIDTQLIHTWHCDLPPTEQRLRTMLYQAMTNAGFVNFPLEWWHYSYGDTEWALHHGQQSTLYPTIEHLDETLIIH